MFYEAELGVMASMTALETAAVEVGACQSRMLVRASAIKICADPFSGLLFSDIGTAADQMRKQSTAATAISKQRLVLVM